MSESMEYSIKEDKDLNIDSRLKFSKKNLIFLTETNKLSHDFLKIKNVSNSSLFFNLKKTEKKNYFSFLNNKQNEYFFYHEDIKIIYPNEEKTIIFSFISNKAGSYTEEYEIIILPEEKLNISCKKVIKLSGFSLKKDELINKRKEFSEDYNNFYIKNIINELLYDIIDDVKTTLPPPPDINNEIIRKEEFEKENKSIYLNYTPWINNLFLELKRELNDYLNIEEDEEWKLNINYFEKKIELIKDEDDKENFVRRFNEYINIASYETYENHYLYNYMKNTLYKLIDFIPEINDEIKKKMEVPLIKYKDPFYEFLPSENEIKTKETQKFKKFKNEEEEKKYYDLIYNEIYENLNEILYQNMSLDKYEINYQKFLNIKEREINLEFIDQIKRKKNIKNFEIFSKRVLLKISIKIYKNSQIDFDENISIENEEDFNKIDQLDLKNFLFNIKDILSFQPKLIVLFIDFVNVDNIELDYNSFIKILYDYLMKIMEVQISIEEKYIADWEDKIENNFYEDGSILFLKDFYNLNSELGYYYDQYNLKNNLYYYEKKELIDLLNSYCNLYINNDIHSFFKSNLTSQSILNCSNSIIGSGISQIFDYISNLFLIKDLYEIEKDNYYNEKSDINLIGLIGGDFKLKKWLFILNCGNLFNQVYLFGKISFYFILYKYKIYDIEGFEINESLKKIFKKFEESINNKNINLILPKNIEYFEKNEENIELFNKLENFKNEEIKNNTTKELDDNNKNLSKDIKNILNNKIIDFKDINEIKNLNKSEENNEEKEKVEEEEEEENNTYFNNNEFYYDFIMENEINNLINDENNKLFIYDNLSIHNSVYNSKLNKNILTKIYFKYKEQRELEEIDFQNNKNDKLFILGHNFIKLINEYYFLNNENESINEEEKEENEENSELYEEEEDENIEKEDEDEKSNSNSNDFEMKNNIQILTNNYLSEENFFLNLFIKNKLNAFDNCEEFERKILDPDDLDFSFIRNI